MGQEKLLLLFPLMVGFFYSYSCHANLVEDSISTCYDESCTYDMSTYPSYFGTTLDTIANMWYQPERSFLKRSCDEVGCLDSSQSILNVKDFGAKGGGTDDTKAFQKTWNGACSSSSPVIFLVPENKNYLIKPITFSGPCKSDITVMIKGTIQASPNRSDWNGTSGRHWIEFEKIKNLRVGGGGTINGNGEIWWKNSCKINKSLPCKNAPTALTFYMCTNLMVKNLMIKDSQQIHVKFEKCSNVQASSLTITAPEKSPNTDGIHVTGTSNIQIANCVIRTGDDCISVVNGTRSLTAKNIVCGPGHGISIGSLGVGKSEAYVSDVSVDTVRLDGTTNGVRIKTWQGGSGYARNIKFQNIAMNNVKNPIIIDQNYCDSKNPCYEQKSAVEVSNVLYQNIKGTSDSQVSIRFDCSKSVPCHGIVLQDINLPGEGGGATKSTCNYVNFTKFGKVIPTPCA